jgi:cobalt/nickel transport protein
MLRTGFATLVLLLAAQTASAHYHMLLPDKASVKAGEKVAFTFQWGHPFEHELGDTERPLSIVVLLPKGGKETLDLDKLLTKIELPGADGKKVAAWRFEYTPVDRGDHTFVVKTKQVELDKHLTTDLVKVALQVQTQNGWDTTSAPFASGLDIRPYTRPYGLLPGMVFKGRVVNLPFKNEFKVDDLQSVNGLRVEIEKYNAKPVKDPPEDELVTFTTKADPNGFFVTTLPEPGWWGITAVRILKSERVGNEQRWIYERATIWVHVNDKK